MNDPSNMDIDSLLHRFLEDREGLSDAEFQQLLEALRTEPHLAERLKDHLVMDELLAQQFAQGRQDFIARLEKRLEEETPAAGDNPHSANNKPNDQPIETYRLRGTELSPANGEASHPAGNGSHPKPAETLATGKTLDRQPPPPIFVPGHPWRTFFSVLAVLALIAGGLAWLEFTPAARQLAIVGEVSGTAFIYRDGVGYVAAPGMRVLPGDELRIPDAARVSILYKDQTRVDFQPNTRAELQPEAAGLPGMLSANLAKEIVLVEGQLEAEVQKQPPGRPMVFKTLELSAEVLGTRLVLAVENEESRLEVVEGQVKVESKLTGKPPVELTAGRQVIATKNEFRVSPGPWPLRTEGAMFLLPPSATVSRSDNEGVRLFAEGRNQSESILRPRRIAKFENGRMVFDHGAFLADDQTAKRLLAACRQTNALSLEATFQTADLSQTGPARWMTFSTSSQSWNFSVGQEGKQCVLRLLTFPPKGGEQKNELPLFDLPDTEPHHLIVTYNPGNLRCYLDGKPVPIKSHVEGSFSKWMPQHLLFGDEWDGDREWQGTLAGVAIYNRALSADEAARNALHYRLRFQENPADGEIEK